MVRWLYSSFVLLLLLVTILWSCSSFSILSCPVPGRLGYRHQQPQVQPRTPSSSSSLSSATTKEEEGGAVKASIDSKGVAPNDGAKNNKVPANLRRKVRAPRPFLGHVVPADVRQEYSRIAKKEEEETNRRGGGGGGGKTKGGRKPSKLVKQGDDNNKRRRGSVPSRLQIASGTAKGRRLESPAVHLRPMMQKVREALYSTLTSWGLYDAGVSWKEGKTTSTLRHLDLFAGSGSVGLESLSRGAAHCTFVDFANDCCQCIGRNLESCGLKDRGQVVRGDVFQFLADPPPVAGLTTESRSDKNVVAGLQPFNLITICPPYEEVVYADLLQAVVDSPLMENAEDVILVVEYPIELESLPHVIYSSKTGSDQAAAIGLRNRRYGRTVLATYIIKPTGRWDGADSRPEEFLLEQTK